MGSDATAKARQEPRWLSTNPSKRWGEQFFLYYSVVWILFFGGVVVTKAYELCGNVGYTAIGLAVAVPCFLYPLLFPGAADRKLPVTQRYWFKANVWVWIITFIGNYFWTHYFYVCLGAKYTFPTTWDINQVPIYLFLITHAYFCSYHTFAAVLLRRVRTGALAKYAGAALWSGAWWTQLTLNTLLVLAMGIVIAFMEAFTISSVPYYDFTAPRYLVYTVGSMFYGIYFYVSFPMFYRIDEGPGEQWTVPQTIIDSFAGCMMVTCLLDFWRLAIGGIVEGSGEGVPFVY